MTRKRPSRAKTVRTCRAPHCATEISDANTGSVCASHRHSKWCLCKACRAAELPQEHPQLWTPPAPVTTPEPPRDPRKRAVNVMTYAPYSTDWDRRGTPVSVAREPWL